MMKEADVNGRERAPRGADGDGASPGEVPLDGRQSRSGLGRKKVAGIACGGCCALSALVMIIGVIGAGLSGDLGAGSTTSPAATGSESTPSTTTVPSTTKQPSETPVDTTKASKKPTSSKVARKKPSETTEASKESPAKPEEDPQAWADKVAHDVIVANAGEGAGWPEVCGGAGWCTYVAGVSATTTGQLHVQLQVPPGDPENKELARATATFIILSTADAHPELDWVIVEDSTGTIIDQYQPSDLRR